MAWPLPKSGPQHEAPKTFRACSAVHSSESGQRSRESWNLDSRDIDAFGEKTPVPLEAILLTMLMRELAGDRGPVPTFEDFFVTPMKYHLASLCDIYRVVTAFTISPPSGSSAWFAESEVRLDYGFLCSIMNISYLMAHRVWRAGVADPARPTWLSRLKTNRAERRVRDQIWTELRYLGRSEDSWTLTASALALSGGKYALALRMAKASLAFVVGHELAHASYSHAKSGPLADARQWSLDIVDIALREIDSASYGDLAIIKDWYVRQANQADIRQSWSEELFADRVGMLLAENVWKSSDLFVRLGAPVVLGSLGWIDGTGRGLEKTLSPTHPPGRLRYAALVPLMPYDITMAVPQNERQSVARLVSITQQEYDKLLSRGWEWSGLVNRLSSRTSQGQPPLEW